MKRFISWILILVTGLIISVPMPVKAVSPPVKTTSTVKKIPVWVDELPVTFDVQPIIIKGRTLVPFRAIAESLNVNVEWNGKTQTVTATDNLTTVRLQINKITAYKNDAAIPLDTPPVIIGGRTLIPIRFFSEAFGCTVAWDAAVNGVRIASPAKEMTVTGYYALGDSTTSSWQDLFGQAYPATGIGNTDLVSDLALGWFSLDPNGNLITRSTTGWQRPDGWEKVLAAADTHKIKTQMIVHMTDKNGAIKNIVNNNAAVERAVYSIAQEAKLYQGVNLDFEGLGLSETGNDLTLVRNQFTNFVSRLSEKLKPAGLTLTLSLHPLNSVYKGYDYKRLGQAADGIIVMAYDYGTKPEPVSLVMQAVEKANAEVPVEKLILGISIPSETPASILGKIGIAKRYKLQGIALWRLGLLSDEMWTSLRSSVYQTKS